MFKNRNKLIFILILMLVGLFLPACQRKPSEKIAWIYNLDSALTLADQSNKPLMIDFMAVWCPPCKAMEESTFCDPAVITKSQAFVTVRIDVDQQPDVANKYNGNARKYGGKGIPNLLFLSAKEDTLQHIVGYYSPADLLAVMDSVLAAFSK